MTDPYRRTTLNGKTIQVYRLVARKVFGDNYDPKKGHVIHHIDGNTRNDDPSNLMLCENHTEHMKIHQRMDSLKNCGDPNKRKCCLCHQWDDPENLKIAKHRAYHQECKRLESRKYRSENREKGNMMARIRYAKRRDEIIEKRRARKDEVNKRRRERRQQLQGANNAF